MTFGFATVLKPFNRIALLSFIDKNQYSYSTGRYFETVCFTSGLLPFIGSTCSEDVDIVEEVFLEIISRSGPITMMAGASSGAGTLGFVVLVVFGLRLRGCSIMELFIVLDIVSQV